VRRSRIALALLGSVSLLAACSAISGEASKSEDIAVAGRWKLPTAVATAGAKVRLRYDGAPDWSTRACSGNLTVGADRLGEYLQEEFSAISSVGGYTCRRNTANGSKVSIHGTGRALDIFIPKVQSGADNGKGDVIANWLVTNSERIGVQLIIWDRTVWQANGRNDGPYTGPHPHDDHLHVELTLAAASMQTPWFRDRDAEPVDFDAETDADAASEQTTDAGDAAPDPDQDPDPEPDSGTLGEPEPPPDSGLPPDSSSGSSGTSTPPSNVGDGGPSGSSAASGVPDDTSTNSTEPLPEDEPAEGESKGTTTKPSAKKRWPRTADESYASSGCSAAPSHSGHGSFAIPLAVVIAASLVRRRRRS
jgi:uncharacterized protein (TIGR03382 family)